MNGSANPRRPYRPIAEHGVIGDLYTVALVSLDGSIDFLCFPHFDSPSIFASLIDHEKGGHFSIEPLGEEMENRQLYLPDSNILLTRFLGQHGVGEISDFMPVEAHGGIAHNLVRRVKTVRGELRYRMRCRPRFDYGRAGHKARKRGDCVVFEAEDEGRTVLFLESSVPVEVQDGDAVAEFDLGANQHATFVLTAPEEDGEESPCGAERYAADAFKNTLNFWREWIGRSTYRGRWREQVNRSALTLKLLFSQAHGSMVAAPTFGLPEVIGGERNWDYRYTWIRDAGFSLYALSRLGYTEEAGRFIEWLGERCTESGHESGLQVLYGIDGRKEVPELELGHLEGYRGSRPVRIGNAAHDQIQLDIYGELMDAVYLYDKHGQPLSIDVWHGLIDILRWLESNWRRPDEGIWEVRGGQHHFVYSRLMCWVAFDRAIRLAHRRSLPAPLGRWYEVRDAIHRDIYENFWDEKRGAFMQYKGGDSLDAATLIMPLVRFIGPTDPRWLSTLRAIEEDLVEDALVHRYRIGEAFPDGLEGKEGTFSMCSFWYVECLSRAGDHHKARLAFEKMLGYANHLGHYAEELGAAGEQLGNFPQAFTHMGLISAAYDLDRRISRAEEEPL